MRKLLILASALLVAALSCKSPGGFVLTAEDEALLDSIERRTIRYFTDFPGEYSGMARERNNDQNGNIVTVGGGGFGIMAIIAGAQRGYYPKEEAVARIGMITEFLRNVPRFHGAWAHWYVDETGQPFSFSEFDDGGDLVETAFMAQGLLTARQWLRREGTDGLLQRQIDTLWREIEWNWYTRGTDSLYWHWSPKYEWKMNHRITGYDETLITYILGASSPTYPISRKCYETSYKQSSYYYNGKKYFGIELPLGMDYGGPLFFSHYSYLGLDPRGLCDGYTNYFERNRAHSLIHVEYAKANPNGWPGYGEDLWGFTSSDDPYLGYSGHYPGTPDDNGTVSPTAAVSSIVYTPEESMRAIRRFVELGMMGPYGLYDAYNERLPEGERIVKHYLAIDQGPEAVMIENFRSGLLWDLFMSAPEVREGLERLGFYYEEQPINLI